MFVCRVFIAPDGVGQVYEEILHRSLRELAEAHQEFRASVNAANHFVEFEGVNREAVARMEAFLKERDFEYDVVIEEKCSESELLRATFVPLLIGGDYIDEDKNGDPLNHHRTQKCPICFLPDEEAVPNPYVVSEYNVRRVQDIYWAHNGIVIVSQKFVSVLPRTVADICQSGEVCVKESFQAKRLKGTFFWLRPKHSLGKECRSKMLKSCETCGAPITVRKTETGDKFLDAQIVLEHFGDQLVDIALSGNWYGQRTQERPMSVVRDIYVSGKLYSLLQEQKLKGVVRPSNVIVASDIS